MIDFDALKLPDGGNFPLKNDIYVLTRPKKLKCRLIGGGASIVRYLVGPAESQALQTVAGCDTAGSENVTFEIAPECYAVGGEGGFRGLNSQIHGIETGEVDKKGEKVLGDDGKPVRACGGMFHLHGNTHKNQFISWATVDAVKGSYGGYAGPAITDDPKHGIYSAKNCVGVELINCEIRGGLTGKYHGLRFHGCDKIVIHGGRYFCPPGPMRNHYNALLRIHDNSEAEIVGSQFIGGNVAFGPMQEDDGGKNLPPGPKRNYYDAMRLAKLTVKDTTFDGGGPDSQATFKFNAGIVAFDLNNVNILNVYGSSLIQTPFPYMTRPASAGSINAKGGTLAKANPKPTLFSDTTGARNIRVTNFAFQTH